MLIYVGEVLFTGNREEVNNCKNSQSSKYNLKKLQLEATRFCGINIVWKDDKIMLDQIDIEFGCGHTKKMWTPVVEGLHKLQKSPSGCGKRLPCRSLVGSLMFRAQTQSDAAYAVGVLGGSSHHFQEEQFQA